MKGVILAGGTGSRLYPLTKVTNKHLLPVYNKPMIYYPILTMEKAGITDILMVLGGESVGEFVRLLGSGRDFGVNLVYKYQDEASGIAEALSLAKDFIGDDKMMVILGDNIIGGDLREIVQNFENSTAKAGIFLREVSDPERFGIAEVRDGRVLTIEEKPLSPKSNYAVTGIYLYDKKVFEIIKTLTPSERGELEITDVNNAFIRNGELLAYYLKGYWIDAGKVESLYKASLLVREVNRRGGHPDD